MAESTDEDEDEDEAQSYEEYMCGGELTAGSIGA
jgi:hypothetical protein